MTRRSVHVTSVATGDITQLIEYTMVTRTRRKHDGRDEE